MGLCIAAGGEVSLDLVAVQIHDDELIRRQRVIRDTGRLDDEKAALPVDARHIAPCVSDKPAAGQLHIGLIDLLLEFFQHSDRSLLAFAFIIADPVKKNRPQSQKHWIFVQIFAAARPELCRA